MVKYQNLSKTSLHIVLADSAWRPFPKNKQRIQIFKDLKKQEIHDIFIKTNQIKVVFKMTWFMEVLKS